MQRAAERSHCRRKTQRKAIQRDIQDKSPGDAHGHMLSLDSQKGAELLDPEFLAQHREKLGFGSPRKYQKIRRRRNCPGMGELFADPGDHQQHRSPLRPLRERQAKAIAERVEGQTARREPEVQGRKMTLREYFQMMDARVDQVRLPEHVPQTFPATKVPLNYAMLENPRTTSCR